LDATISSALAIAPFMPFAPSVNTKLTPKPRNKRLRSVLMVSGMVKVILYPRAAATYAKAIPVLPLVASTISLSLVKMPSFSACQIMLAPIRHFTL